MAYLGKRLEPAPDVTPKLGDKVVYEVIYDDGQVGTITTFVSKFDLMISGHEETDKKTDKKYR